MNLIEKSKNITREEFDEFKKYIQNNFELMSIEVEATTHIFKSIHKRLTKLEKANV